MLSVGLFVKLEAKPGKEEAVEVFLRQGLEMANQEATTLVWFALRLGPNRSPENLDMSASSLAV